MASTTSPVQLAPLVCINYNNFTNRFVPSGEKAQLEFARQRGWLEYCVIAGTTTPSPSSIALTAPPADGGACDDRSTSSTADRVERETAPTTTPPAKENVPATRTSAATATTVAGTTQARASSPVTLTNTAQARPSTAAARPATAQVRTASVATRDATLLARIVRPVTLASPAKASSVILSDTAEENTMTLPLHLDTAEGHAAVQEEEKDSFPLCPSVNGLKMRMQMIPISVTDDIDTEDYIHETTAIFFEDVAGDDWSLRENANANPDFLRDTELKAVSSAWVVYDQDHSGDLQVDGASDLYNGRWGPTESARAYAESPLAMFYYFMPKLMWTKIAEESNRYRASVVDEAAIQKQRRQQQWQLTHPDSRVQSLSDIKDTLSKVKPFQAHEIVHYIALLIARALCAHRRSLENHWSTSQNGAIPRGTFGKFMTRKRFEEITRYLHFNDNANNRRKKDKAWKLRPVLQMIEKTFRNGYRMGSTLSFDEGIIGSRHQYNPMRIYMKDKPTKWEPSFTWSAVLIQHTVLEDTESAISKAVIRNLTKALRGQPGKRLVVTDNSYTCVQLAERLLRMGIYTVGTTRVNRKGWSERIQFPSKKKQKQLQPQQLRTKLSAERTVSLIIHGFQGWSPLAGRIQRSSTSWQRDAARDGLLFNESVRGMASLLKLRAPEQVRIYNKGMGGVDQHDQLRLHRYSIQKALRHRSYYKNLFFGIVDMALVNGFIIHKLVMKEQGKPVPTHADYLARLHMELLAQKNVDFQGNMHAQNLLSTPLAGQPHVLTKTAETYKNKVRQYLCKVCSAYSDKEHRSFETPYSCEECSLTFGGRVALCNKVRREERGNTDTCHQT
ncbi:hypothetical protein F443_12767 [Phytophthora nicotianae P1569]|uniref:PiggyBac transposable element-derived protein domain-containing protein n=1 Tax=Phytophthora nicotianae P1569 TaxID=1317065 RepID=V9ET68_PHYNI|nr:hypothetical protein F443_12767 [Phytophthora nicotianae P1569]